MVQTQSKTAVVAADAGGGGGGVSLGKGAWDCDRNVEIPPEAEVITFPTCTSPYLLRSTFTILFRTQKATYQRALREVTPASH